MMSKIIVLIFTLNFCSIALSQASVKIETKKPTVEIFELKDICEKSGLKHILLATPKGNSHVDCMGTAVSISSFCKKQFPDDPRLLRGFINHEKKGACHFADSVILSVDCSMFQKFCKNATQSCNELKTSYAINLELNHAGVVKKTKGDTLKCYFVKNISFEK